MASISYRRTLLGQGVALDRHRRITQIIYYDTETRDTLDMDIALSDIVWVDDYLYGIEKNENKLHRIKIDL